MGGLRIINIKCENCLDEFKAPVGRKRCDVCRYLRNCKYCNSKFSNGYRYSIYCDECKNKKIWLRKETSCRNFAMIGKKITKSKLKFYKTERGEEVAKSIGLKNSINTAKFNKTEAGHAIRLDCHKRQSEIMKKKILNGEFTPCITNIRTHWSAIIKLEDGSYKKFRSSWEAVFWNSNKYLEFEAIRIPWYDEAGIQHTYIVDFYDRIKNIIYEIKPKSTWGVQNIKMQQIINYCLINNIKFIWINDDNILSYINEDDFHDENLDQLQKVYNGIKKNKNYKN